MTKSNLGLVLAMMSAATVGAHMVFLLLHISGVAENVFGPWLSVLGIVAGITGCFSGVSLAWHRKPILR